MFPDTGQAPASGTVMRLHEVKELFQIVEKKKLNDAVVMVRIVAPLIAKKVLPDSLSFSGWTDSVSVYR